MNKEEIEDIETLEVDFKDTDELELALEVSSKKAIYLIDDLIKHLFDLQQENKQLKDNWNKLKEIAKSQSGFKKRADLKGELWFEIDELLDKMQELEKGDSNGQ